MAFSYVLPFPVCLKELPFVRCETWLDEAIGNGNGTEITFFKGIEEIEIYYIELYPLGLTAI